jgi:hypothetical protein
MIITSGTSRRAEDPVARATAVLARHGHFPGPGCFAVYLRYLATGPPAALPIPSPLSGADFLMTTSGTWIGGDPMGQGPVSSTAICTAAFINRGGCTVEVSTQVQAAVLLPGQGAVLAAPAMPTSRR